MSTWEAAFSLASLAGFGMAIGLAEGAYLSRTRGPAPDGCILFFSLMAASFAVCGLLSIMVFA